MSSARAIIEAYERGHPALYATGRSLYDLDVDESDGKLRIVLDILRRELFANFGLMLATYSLAARIQLDGVGEASDRGAIEKLLGDHHLLKNCADEDDQVRVLRGLHELVRRPTGITWRDGRAARIGFVLEFAEHLTPCSATAACSDAQLQSIELATALGTSLALRKSGNLLIFEAREGLLDDRVAGALHRVHLRQPDAAAKRRFLAVATKVYPKATFAEGLAPAVVAHITANTPNRGVEQLLRSSHISGRPIAAKELSDQKRRDVEEISEHTLAALDAGRSDGVVLCGQNVEVPRRLLDSWVSALARGDRSTPLTVVLVGPPGTGKTVLAIGAAAKAMVPAYQLRNPKGSLVGETERKARLQFEALNEWGGVGFVDEITEALPLQRSDFNGDSGATQAVSATLLTELSNEAVRGRRLLIGTTNSPERIGAAMRSRLRFLPVLHPLPGDYPHILIGIATALAGGQLEFDENDANVRRAAQTFYDRGASPRVIRDLLGDAFLHAGGILRSSALVDAANDLAPSCDLESVVYADLWAVRVCSRKSFLPWAADPAGYDFPPHLADVVDVATGDIDTAKLDRKIESLRPHANV